LCEGFAGDVEAIAAEHVGLESWASGIAYGWQLGCVAHEDEAAAGSGIDELDEIVEES
jgi:hypothetical protein